MKLQVQFHIVRTEARWPSRPEVIKAAGLTEAKQTGNRSLRGKTAGFLVSTSRVSGADEQGYGHIARETARLLKAFNCEIIAANTKGDKRPEEGVRSQLMSELMSSTPCLALAMRTDRSPLLTTPPPTPQASASSSANAIFSLPACRLSLIHI